MENPLRTFGNTGFTSFIVSNHKIPWLDIGA